MALLKIKVRKEELELAIKEAGEIMHQNQVTIETKEAYLQKLAQEYKETKYTLEQQIKRDTKAFNLRLNELEQKITLDSLEFTQAKKRHMEEVNSL